jgi:hypothetical protein
MERELWPRLYHLVMEVGPALRLSDVTYQPHIIVLVWLWAALHDRPVNWACDEKNWATTRLRPATLPDPSTLSRRLRRVDTAMLMRAVVDRVRQEGDPHLVAVIDAKPLPVGGASEDPEARWGRGAGGTWAKGYTLYAIWGSRPVPETYRVQTMNTSEDKVALDMIPELTGSGDLLGDGEDDATAVFDAAGAAGDPLLAPRKEPEAGLGHRPQSPFRLRCIELMRSAFGRGISRLRRGIERTFGTLTSFGSGLAPLPAWVRHLERVWLGVSAKLLINGVRVVVHQGLAT